MINWFQLSVRNVLSTLLVLSLAACTTSAKLDTYHDPNMDFGALRTVAVMPFENLTRDKLAAERVRDTFTNYLLATNALYVIPPGEVARGVVRANMLNPAAPSAEELAKFAAIVKVDAVITGVLQEYGEVRSGGTSANIITLSMQMIDIQSRKVVWSASSTKGGISLKDRLLGGGGKPMNDVTEAAINDILTKLFK